MPRINSRQVNRCNIQTQNPEEYYKVSLFIPLLDNIIQDLKFRFSSELFQILDINNFIPVNILNLKQEDLMPIIINVSEYLAKFKSVSVQLLSDLLRSELDIWISKWEKAKQESIVLPETVLQTLHLCNKDIFPNLYTLLQLISVMPVSVTSAERSFSTLKRLKTLLRSTMAQERLVELTLLNIHKDIEVNIDAVINRFCKQRSRKTDFVL